MEEGRILGKKEIGAAIRQRRRELALSQEGLAVRLNVSYQQIQRYENGKSGISVENLQHIAQALAVPIDYFFSGGAGALNEKEGGDVERELLAHYRKIRHQKIRAMVVNFARLVAGWEMEKNFRPERLGDERRARTVLRQSYAQDIEGGTEEQNWLAR